MKVRCKFRIIFWDGSDESTKEYITAEQAYKDDLITFKGNELVPTDECTIIESVAFKRFNN